MYEKTSRFTFSVELRLWKMLSSLHKAKVKWCGRHVKWGSQVKPNMGWRDIDNDQTWAAIIGVEACASCDISDVCSKCKVWSGLRGPLAESSWLFDRVICERPAASFNFKCTFLAAVKSGLLSGSSFLIVAKRKWRCGGETWEGAAKCFKSAGLGLEDWGLQVCCERWVRTRERKKRGFEIAWVERKVEAGWEEEEVAKSTLAMIWIHGWFIDRFEIRFSPCSACSRGKLLRDKTKASLFESVSYYFCRTYLYMHNNLPLITSS